MSIKKMYSKKPRKFGFLVLIMIVVILSIGILMSIDRPSSIIQTGTGNIPNASIRHLSTFERTDVFFVTFKITVQDPDNDTVQAYVEIKAAKATKRIQDIDGNMYDPTNWTIVWSKGNFDSIISDPSLNPFSGDFRLTFLEDVSFKARIVVADVGGNVVFEEISSSVIKKFLEVPAFELPILIIGLITFYCKKKLNKDRSKTI
jgi:hypothetical protein